jgi:hypothetical protein
MKKFSLLRCSEGTRGLKNRSERELKVNFSAPHLSYAVGECALLEIEFILWSKKLASS